MPVTRGKYWYITSYFGLLIFVPFLNVIVNHIDRNLALTVLTVFFIVVVTLPVFLFNHGDPYNLLKGKDMFGLMLYYLMGAFIGKFELDKKISKKTFWWTIIICIGASWLVKIIIVAINQQKHLLLNSDFLTKNTFVAPTILLSAAAVFCLFPSLNLKRKTIKLVEFFAPATLGVYLIHTALIDAYLQYWVMIPGRDQMNPLLLLVLLLAISLLVYVACSLVDIVRIYLFKLLRVDKLSVKIGAVFDRWLEKLNDRFTKVLSA
ncbi:MAG: acyltransferase [Lactobacillus sp.]|jgi:surface polysaccharide O-acyltransferase-like enzyme|nr:acyltransferase [Lactobacillus sp.]MCI1974002.1 acyltransferase [Lactobacillus sp.]